MTAPAYEVAHGRMVRVAEGRLVVEWYVTHEGKPLLKVSLPSARITPAYARALAADLLRAAEESERPDAAQVSAERAP